MKLKTAIVIALIGTVVHTFLILQVIDELFGSIFAFGRMSLAVIIGNVSLILFLAVSYSKQKKK